jgi:hypothetical protein
MAVASARATSAATNDGCGWLEAETVASAAAQARYEDVWLAEHAREVPCALAAYRDGERHDEASRRAGVADPFTQATPTIRSLCKPRLGQQASWGLPGTGTVPDPVTAVSDPITVLSDPITVLSDPITVLSDPITVLACLLPVTSKYDTVLSKPIPTPLPCSPVRPHSFLPFLLHGVLTDVIP